MILVSTYKQAYRDDEGTSWTRLDEAEAETQEAANVAARTLIHDAVNESGLALDELAVLFEDADHQPEEIDYQGGAFVEASEWILANGGLELREPPMPQPRCPICASIIGTRAESGRLRCQTHGRVMAVYGNREEILARSRATG